MPTARAPSACHVAAPLLPVAHHLAATHRASPRALTHALTHALNPAPMRVACKIATSHRVTNHLATCKNATSSTARRPIARIGAMRGSTSIAATVATLRAVVAVAVELGARIRGHCRGR